MKFTYFLFLLLILFKLSSSQVRMVTELRDGWKFSKGKNDQAFQPGFKDDDWQQVAVPHDWAIYGPFDKTIDSQVVAITQNNETVASEKTGRTGALPYIGEGWYRKAFSLPQYKTGQKVIILFDGAMSEPRVYLNGEKIGEWNYGYNYFYFDVSQYFKPNQPNLLAVHLSNMGRSSRWYPGAGLFRKVSIIVKNPESIDQWGTYITTPFISAELAKVNIKTKVTGEHIQLFTSILDAQGELVSIDTATKIFGQEFDQDLALSNPVLWSPESPYLYTAISKLYVDNELKDETSTRFGIRSISYKPGTGFQLNGHTRKFKGVCLHHDFGPLGAAVNIAALRPGKIKLTSGLKEHSR